MTTSVKESPLSEEELKEAYFLEVGSWPYRRGPPKGTTREKQAWKKESAKAGFECSRCSALGISCKFELYSKSLPCRPCQDVLNTQCSCTIAFLHWRAKNQFTENDWKRLVTRYPDIQVLPPGEDVEFGAEEPLRSRDSAEGEMKEICTSPHSNLLKTEDTESKPTRISRPRRKTQQRSTLSHITLEFDQLFEDYQEEVSRNGPGRVPGTALEKIKWRNEHPDFCCSACKSTGKRSNCIDVNSEDDDLSCSACRESPILHCSCIDAFLHWRARRVLSISDAQWSELVSRYPEVARLDFFGPGSSHEQGLPAPSTHSSKTSPSNDAFSGPTTAPPTSNVHHRPESTTGTSLLPSITVSRPQMASHSAKPTVRPNGLLELTLSDQRRRIQELEAQLALRDCELTGCREALSEAKKIFSSSCHEHSATIKDLNKEIVDLQAIGKEQTKIISTLRSRIGDRDSLLKRLQTKASKAPTTGTSTESSTRELVSRELLDARADVDDAQTKAQLYRDKLIALEKVFEEFNADNVPQYLHIQKCHEHLSQACKDFEGLKLKSREFLTIIQKFLPHFEEMGKRRLQLIPLADMNYSEFRSASYVKKRPRDDFSVDGDDDEEHIRSRPSRRLRSEVNPTSA